MADITSLFGGPFRPEEKHVDPPDVQLINAIDMAGLVPPKSVVFDGKIHRFSASGKAGDDTGWYVAFSDGIHAGRFGCWRNGPEHDQTWRADVGRTLTAAEEMAIIRRMQEAKAARDAELSRKREIAADTVAEIWASAGAASPDHPYLKRKGIQPHGARITGDGRLIVPLVDVEGNIHSLQYIDHNGGKLYHPGASTGGKFWTIGAHSHGPIYIAEGFATAATIHETSGAQVYVGYSASGLVSAAEAARQAYGIAAELVVVADNDAHGVGQKYAEQAAAKHGCRIVIPPIPGDANDYAISGGDLIALLSPPQTAWLEPLDAVRKRRTPVKWLVKGWMPESALVMIHGPSGGGKTFFVLDMALTIAAGNTDWRGCKVNPGSVVYLAGEGHIGLGKRVEAWCQETGAQSLQAWMSKSGCDLNTPQGYQDAAQAIRALPDKPKLIIVDTLHRFLMGDENSAQDAKTMLDACAGLMQEFGATVVLVHHTGVSAEAQHRARGSSAWRGALDVEINVMPSKDGPMKISQMKMKDAESLEPRFFDLAPVAIDGWIDEDGEQVQSAILKEADAPQEGEKKESKLASHQKIFASAWRESGAERDHLNRPILNRSALRDYLIETMGMSAEAAKKQLQAGETSRLVGSLLVAEMIEATHTGWAIVHPIWGGAVIMGA